jgi:hypothetical protein
MRFPSLNLVLAATAAVARRFPWPVAAAAVSTVSGLLLIDSGIEDKPVLRWMAAGTLGLALLTGLTLAGERRSPRVALWLPLAGVAVLAAVFWLWPRWSEPVQLRRYFQLSLGFHFLVAWLPYAGRAEANGFWQYNRRLFLRFLLGALYSAVLFVGLSIALVALDKLLGADVDEDVYFRLWMVIAFSFQTLFFLGGLPSSFPALESDTRHPTGLKVFSQFILLPIVVLYLAILTCYMAKIGITQVWPSGWIGYLVSSVAAVGILSLLLVHPVQERAENRWVKTYGRWFYIALFPSIVMLLLAVWKRIGQYGVTENRYFLVVLSLWLTGIAVYFTVSRVKSIKIIPLSLCSLAFLTCFGPWGAYAVSARSQLGRLESLLARSGMLDAGAVHPRGEPVAFEDRREISAALDYLLRTHGRSAVDRRLHWPAPADTTPPLGGNQARVLLAAVDLEYVERWAGRDQRYFHLYPGHPPRAVAVSGYDYAVRADSGLPFRVAIGARELEFSLAQAPPAILIREDALELARISLGPVIALAENRRDESPPGGPQVEPLLLTAEGNGLRVQARILNVNGEFEGDTGRIRSLQADFHLSLEPPPE